MDKGNVHSVSVSRNRLGKVKSEVGAWASKELGPLFLEPQLSPLQACGYWPDGNCV